MQKRLQLLKQLVGNGSTDPFHHYALALEYRSAGQIEDALRVLESLKTTAPEYLPQYMIAGTLLLQMGRAADARPWFEQGVRVARDAGDPKTAAELQEALDSLPEP